MIIVAIIEAVAARERKKEKQCRELAKQERQKDEALFLGVQSLLRSEIIRSYNHYMDQTYIPIYGMENVLSLYGSYHELGGNGTITKLIEALRSLPTEPTNK